MWRRPSHSLNVPTTDTRRAFGAHTVNAVQLYRMRAQAIVFVQMGTFGHIINVHIPQHGRKAVSVFGVIGFALPQINAQTVFEVIPIGGEFVLEQPRAVDAFHLRHHFARFVFQNVNVLRLRLERADNQIAIRAFTMNPQDGERIPISRSNQGFYDTFV